MAGPGYSSLERAVLHRLAETTGKAVDLAYAGIVHQLGITKRFFEEGGFGDLRVVDFHNELKAFQSWPPPHFEDAKLDWRRVREGNYGSHSYSVFRAAFPTLARGTAYDAMPVESRTAHVLWIAPHQVAPGAPTVIHLAATGDHGFARREHLAIPLVARGVGSLALESPFYGVRKPAAQMGAKLRRVSDLLLLGKATIEESLFLLLWLSRRGHLRLGMSGLSMGGVHASMVAALYPEAVALSPLLAPRSAAQSYCHGALFHATAWDRLVEDTEGRQAEIVEVVRRAAVAKERMAAAKVRKEALLVATAQEEGASGNGANGNAVSSLSHVPLVVGNEKDKGQGIEQQPLSSSSSTSSKATAASEQQQQQWHWAGVAKWMEQWGSALQGQLKKVERMEKENVKGGDKQDRHAAAVLMLEAVLETFTDATRFPCPRRPDAAVLVAATEDAYVSPQSVVDLHRHLPGSEVRWIPGGHVSSFLLHQPAFRSAIVDSLDKL